MSTRSGAAAAIGEKVTAVAVPNRAEGERQLRDGTIDVLLWGPPTGGTCGAQGAQPKRGFRLDRARQQQVFNKQITAAGGDPSRYELRRRRERGRRALDAEPYQAQRPRSPSWPASCLSRPAGLRAGGRAGRGGEKANRIVELLPPRSSRRSSSRQGDRHRPAGLLQRGVGRRAGGGRAPADVLTLPTSVATSVASGR